LELGNLKKDIDGGVINYITATHQHRAEKIHQTHTKKEASDH